MVKKIENGHTQGRWVYGRYSHGGGAYIGVAVPAAGNYDASDISIMNVSPINPFYNSSEESKKVELKFACNMRLIAQSPEMYKYIAQKADEGDFEAAEIISRCALYLPD